MCELQYAIIQLKQRLRNAKRVAAKHRLLVLRERAHGRVGAYRVALRYLAILARNSTNSRKGTSMNTAEVMEALERAQQQLRQLGEIFDPEVTSVHVFQGTVSLQVSQQTFCRMFRGRTVKVTDGHAETEEDGIAFTAWFRELQSPKTGTLVVPLAK